MICQEIKCPDCDGGDPVWCLRAGCPAAVAAAKCPKAEGKQKKEEGRRGK